MQLKQERAVGIMNKKELSQLYYLNREIGVYCSFRYIKDNRHAACHRNIR
jgi:hypothetical protein